MELSKKERWLLSNQYRILEKLDPEDADYYARCRKVVEDGYELHYDWITDYIVDPMTPEQCSEIRQILEMYDFLQRAYENLKDKEGIDGESISFQGFDGNNEAEVRAYALFIIEEQKQFQYLKHTKGLNSHFRSLPYYRLMLKEWNASPDKHHLTKADVIRITSVRFN
jgi:uncharacterized protein YfbU (UPF0304 family)